MENNQEEFINSEIQRLREMVVLSQSISDNIEREARRYPRNLDGGHNE